MTRSGYCDCACGTCFDIAIRDADEQTALCLLCQDAGCEPDAECQRCDLDEDAEG